MLSEFSARLQKGQNRDVDLRLMDGSAVLRHEGL